jgi:hypothetical protein
MNVQVSNGILEQKEIDAYVKMAQDKYGDKLVGLKINVENDDEVTLTYILKNNVPFERIRRITGYLVGTLDKWNDAKRAEERDRVKHTVDKDFGDNA